MENNARKLSVFVDESGSFLYPDRDSRFYIIGMVFHDQSMDIGPQLKEMDRAIEEIGMVRPAKYRLFQLADLVCTLNLIALKLSSGMAMSRSESKFFGGPKAFRHNVLRRIKSKEI